MAEKTTATERGTDKRPPQRKISKTELARILSAHEAWVDSRGDSGRRADLAGADLRGVDLRDAVLSGAVLRGADLRDALLGRAQLRAADLEGANLGNANLSGAMLESADLTGANLENAKLHLGDLRRANLARANLRGTSLIDADLQGCNLLHADLRGAGLLAANLLEADMTAADLAGAYIRSADFRAAVNLTCDQLCQAEDWEESHRDPSLRCGARIPKEAPRRRPEDAIMTPEAAWTPPPAQHDPAPQAAAPSEAPPAPQPEPPAAAAMPDAEAPPADGAAEAEPLRLDSGQIEPNLEPPPAPEATASAPDLPTPDSDAGWGLDEVAAQEPEAPRELESTPEPEPEATSELEAEEESDPQAATARRPAATISVQPSDGRSAVIGIAVIMVVLAAIGGWWMLSGAPSADALIEGSKLEPKSVPDAEIGDAAAKPEGGNEDRNVDGTAEPPAATPDTEKEVEKPAAAAAPEQATDSAKNDAAKDKTTASPVANAEERTAALAALSPEAAADTEKATLIGTFRDWRAFANGSGSGRICFIKSEPIKTETSIGRKGVRTLLAQWPEHGDSDEISVSAGADFRPETEVEVRIGDSVFKLQTPRDNSPGGVGKIFLAAAPDMVEAMKRGEIMVISGTTIAGTPAEDIYSLYGFTAAYDAIHQRCTAD